MGLNTPPFNASPWRKQPDVLKICEALFDDDCEQDRFGALFNFPGSRTYAWHRDGPNRLIVALTTDRNYPAEAGWVQVQPHTHIDGKNVQASTVAMPLPGEPAAVKMVLRRGDVLLFQYSLKHGATPNPTDHDRCLLY